MTKSSTIPKEKIIFKHFIKKLIFYSNSGNSPKPSNFSFIKIEKYLSNEVSDLTKIPIIKKCPSKMLKNFCQKLLTKLKKKKLCIEEFFTRKMMKFKVLLIPQCKLPFSNIMKTFLKRQFYG